MVIWQIGDQDSKPRDPAEKNRDRTKSYVTHVHPLIDTPTPCNGRHASSQQPVLSYHIMSWNIVHCAHQLPLMADSNISRWRWWTKVEQILKLNENAWSSITQSLRGNGVMDSALTCCTGGPGSSPAIGISNVQYRDGFSTSWHKVVGERTGARHMI